MTQIKLEPNPEWKKNAKSGFHEFNICKIDSILSVFVRPWLLFSDRSTTVKSTPPHPSSYSYYTTNWLSSTSSLILSSDRASPAESDALHSWQKWKPPCDDMLQQLLMPRFKETSEAADIWQMMKRKYIKHQKFNLDKRVCDFHKM